MTPFEVFEQERTDYLCALKSCLHNIRERDPEAASEVLIELNNDHIPRPYRFFRPDILYRDHGKPKIAEAVKDEYHSFDPHELVLSNGLKGILHPFQWDKIGARLHGEISDWAPFEDWVNKWLDVADDRTVPNVDFTGSIHHVTRPTHEAGVWSKCIDMGSADVDALNDLFGVFGSLGVERFEMGSFEIGN